MPVFRNPRIGSRLGGVTSGSVLFGDSNGYFAEDNSTHFWDATNKRLGLGVSSSLAGKVHAKSGSATEPAAVFQAAGSQTGNTVELRDSSGNVTGGFKSDQSLLIPGISTTSINSTNYYAGFARGDTNVYGSYAYVVDRNYPQNNLGNGTAFFLKDNNVYAGLRLWTNTASQSACDLEIVTQNGIMMVFPYTGGIKAYNPFQNTNDISVFKVPTQTLYPGGGTPSPQGTFRFNVVTISATSPNSLTDCAGLVMDGAPVVGTNMTITNRWAALFLTGDTGGKGLGIRGSNGQTVNLQEWQDYNSNVLAAVSANGYFSCQGLGLKVTSKTGTYTAADETVILCDASGGAFSVNLPAAASSTNRIYIIKKTDSSTNAVTLDANSTETIDGALTHALSYQYNSVTVACNGSNWFII